MLHSQFCKRAFVMFLFTLLILNRKQPTRKSNQVHTTSTMQIQSKFHLIISGHEYFHELVHPTKVQFMQNAQEWNSFPIPKVPSKLRANWYALSRRIFSYIIVHYFVCANKCQRCAIILIYYKIQKIILIFPLYSQLK